MSISPAQMVPQVSGVERQESPGWPVPSQLSPAPQAAPAAAVPASALPAAPQLSTEMKVDNHHQVYYECVDERTGSVLFEIPPEALRAIGESLNLPLEGESSGVQVDVKS